MISIAGSTCTGCGACATVCPRHIPELVSQESDGSIVRVSPERAALCMNCGHCAAVCPTGAISVVELEMNDITEPESSAVTAPQVLAMLRQRRSIRRYQKRAVPRAVLDQIVAAVDASPTGTGSFSNGVIIVDRNDVMEPLMDRVYAMYTRLGRTLRIPILRQMVGLRVGANAMRMLRRFVMPGVRWYIRWRNEGKGDEISRDCPAFMLFFGPEEEPMVEDNCTLAAFHAILMAEALGVGSCFNHLIPPACNRDRKIRALLGLSKNERVYTCITLGYPAIRFLRAIPRRCSEVRYLEAAGVASDGMRHEPRG